MFVLVFYIIAFKAIHTVISQSRLEQLRTETTGLQIQKKVLLYIVMSFAYLLNIKDINEIVPKGQPF